MKLKPGSGNKGDAPDGNEGDAQDEIVFMKLEELNLRGLSSFQHFKQ